jgi:hypothetical protein
MQVSYQDAIHGRESAVAAIVPESSIPVTLALFRIGRVQGPPQNEAQSRERPVEDRVSMERECGA